MASANAAKTAPLPSASSAFVRCSDTENEMVKGAG